MVPARCSRLSPLALAPAEGGASTPSTDGLAGVQQLAGDATLLYYMSEEAQEGRDAYQGEAPARLLAVPEAPVSAGVRRVGARRAPADAGRGVVPVVVGDAAAGHA